MNRDEEDLVRRLRTALTSQRPAEPLDTDTFLASIHRGARVRRVKRGVSVAAVAALAVAGGGVAINAGGFLEPSHSPIAGRPSGVHVTPSSVPSSATGVPTRPSRSRVATIPATTPPKTESDTVTITPVGPIAATDVVPVSLTATGTLHQWVLAETHEPGCSSGLGCATIFMTDDHGASWTDIGRLPAPPASSDNPTPVSVSQLRFTKRDDGSDVYDGWAYGGALWSTHDSGRSWSNAGAPPGRVTQLEAWGGDAYAGVSSATPGDDTAVLYRTPTTTDAWQPVDVGAQLTSVQALAAANGIVGLIDSGGLHSKLYLSSDGQNWQPSRPCPLGTDPHSLSTAGDPASGVGALWVTCTNATTAVVRYRDATGLGLWHDVNTGKLGPAVMLAARDAGTAFIASGSVQGIVRISATAVPQRVYPGPLTPPLYFAFTNQTHGYLISSNGSILATSDGGVTWPPYAVTETKP